MLLVPGLIAALIGAHLYLVAKLGTTAPPWLKAEPSTTCAGWSVIVAACPIGMPLVNQREKEQYLREYSILQKAKGKPFFPYAVTKDSAMA